MVLLLLLLWWPCCDRHGPALAALLSMNCLATLLRLGPLTIVEARLYIRTRPDRQCLNPSILLIVVRDGPCTTITRTTWFQAAFPGASHGCLSPVCQGTNVRGPTCNKKQAQSCKYRLTFGCASCGMYEEVTRPKASRRDRSSFII